MVTDLDFKKLEAYVNKLREKTPPCQYSVDELKDRILQGEEEIENGNTISHAQVFEEYGL